MTLTLSCSNPQCESTMWLPFTVNSVFPTIENRCAVCNQGVLIISQIENEAPPLATTAAIHAEAPASDVSLNESLGGNRIFTAFQNRLAPLVVILQLIDELSEETGDVEISALVEAFKERSGLLRKHLSDRLEHPLGVKRGQKLSDGFPAVDRAGPLNITLRNYIGCEQERLLVGRGLIQEFGLVNIVDDTKLKLTEKAKPFLKLPHLADKIQTTQELVAFYSTPVLPKYYEEAFAFELAHAVGTLAPDQHDWMMHILGETIACEGKNGWDSNAYAADETQLASVGKAHARWRLIDHTYGTLYEKFKAQAERKAHHDPEGQARSRHESHVNGKLGSVLSHLKELGFIVPVAVGNTKNFSATERGHRYQDSMSKGVEK